MEKSITVREKKMHLPIYFPDATRAVVRGLATADVKKTGIEGLVLNTYHLMTQPGTAVLEKVGGVKNLMDWDGFVITDSGGFQLFSMLLGNPSFGKITDDGIFFYRGSTKKKNQKVFFTPEKSIQVQFKINSDIMICLDDFTPPDANKKRIELSVKRTIEWSKRAKEEYLKQIEIRKIAKKSRPLLLAVIQGHFDKKLRAECAEALLEIGFDGFGFGGWPIDEKGKLDMDITKFISNLIPEGFIRFGLGVGKPCDIVNCYKLGFQLFDCVLPTRDARHGRLYIFNKDPDKIDILEEKDFYKFLYISRKVNANDFSPVSEFCDCDTCKNYSRAYLHHLFEIGDTLAGRLATIHNLRMYAKVIELLRSKESNRPK